MVYMCTDPAVDLIAQFLEPTPEKRIGNLLNGSADIQAHPWFTNLDFQKLYDEALVAPHIPPQGSLGGNEHARGPRGGKKQGLDLSGVLTKTDDKAFWLGW